MNEQHLGYSVIAAAAYAEGRSQFNRLDNDRLIDALVAQRVDYISNPSSGFEASAYQYNGQVVIAYAGTEVGQNADLIADAMLGLGIQNSQLIEAAKFYYQVKAQYGDNIVFTGHSLGGGLAALMGVFFDKQAVTFDPAPFRLAATQSNAQALAQTLRNGGYAENAALNSYTTQETPLAIAMPELLAAASVVGTVAGAPILISALLGQTYPDVIAREHRVSAYAVSGEFLTNGYAGWGADILNKLRIKSTATPELIDINPPSLSGLDLHSQALLIAASSAPELVTVLKNMPILGAALFDKALYARAPSSTEVDFLVKLIQNEFTVGASRTGFIARFASSMQLLSGNQVLLNEVAKKALIAQAMDWYYAQSATVSQPFFTQTAGVLQYTTAQGEGLAGAQNRASKYLNPWLTPMMNAEDQFGGNTNYGQWNVSTGAEAATATARDASKTQMFVGNAGADQFTGGDQADLLLGAAGADVLDGGQGADLLLGGEGGDQIKGGAGADELIGGEGADTLEGGEGRDQLKGGAGADVYEFTGDFGRDVIEDSDGQGSIKVDGQAIPFGSLKKVSDNFYRDKGTGWTVTKAGQNSNGTSTLVIQTVSEPGRSIIVREWKDGDFGVILPQEREEISQSMRIIYGDRKPLVLPEKSYQIIQAGELDGRIPYAVRHGEIVDDYIHEEGFYDVIGLEYFIDHIDGVTSWGSGYVQAYSGNDQVAGYIGDDKIDGGEGSDFLMGGGGLDTLIGGAGDDYLWGGNRGWGFRRYEDQLWSDNASSFRPDQGDYIVNQGAVWALYYDAGAEDFIFGVNAENMSNSWVDFGVLNPRTVDVLGDIYYGDGGTDYIFAGENIDYIDGGEDGDLVRGGGGGDYIFGQGGDDFLYGEGGVVLDFPEEPWLHNFTLRQNSGDDLIDGGEGSDYIYGQGGDDEIYGGGNNDFLFGDVFKGGSEDQLINLIIYGNDYLDGGEGDDLISGDGGADKLYGGGGADTVYGDDGVAYLKTPKENQRGDYIFGGGGVDVLCGQGGGDSIFGGEDGDRLYGDDYDAEIDIEGNDYLNGEGGDDQIIGAADDDTLIGGGGADTLIGDGAELGQAYHGADHLSGDGGTDILLGGGLDDELFGGDGNDTLLGDDENVAIDMHGNDYLDGGKGNDELSGQGGQDIINGGDDDDTLMGNAGNDYIYGGDGGDWLQGDLGEASFEKDKCGNDYLDGGAGVDVIFGDGGSDNVIGGDGNDVLYGDNARDVLDFVWHGNDILFGGAGVDLIFGGAGNDVIHGGGDDDRLHGDDAQSDADGDDVIFGNEGNDQLSGGRGKDTLSGDAGNDVLIGGEGNDCLISGFGQDFLIGGVGNDVYIVNSDHLVEMPGESYGVVVRDQSGQNSINIFGGAIVGYDVIFGATILYLDNGGRLQLDNAFALAKGSSNRVLVGDISFDLNDWLLNTQMNQINLSLRQSLVATEGNMYLSGTPSDDRFDASTFSGITMQGGGGQDTYNFGGNSSGNKIIVSVGDGRDNLIGDGAWAHVDESDFNSILIRGGVRAADVKLHSYTNYNMGQRLVYGVGDEIRFSVGLDINKQPFDLLLFDDGSSISWRNLLDKGFIIEPDAGRQVGTMFADRFTLRPGDEVVEGRSGNDVFIFNYGDGNDTIAASERAETDNKTIIFSSGISRSDAIFIKSGEDLLVKFKSTNADSLIIIGAFGHECLFNFVFEDGGEFTNTSVVLGAFIDLAGGSDDFVRGWIGSDALSGLGGNDDLLGGPGDDYICGNMGDDELAGEEGADTLVGGEGQDSINSGNGNDWVEGGKGDDVILSSLEGYLQSEAMSVGGRDVYYYGWGDGNDVYMNSVLAEHYNEFDFLAADLSKSKFIFGAGIRPEDVRVTLIDNIHRDLDGLLVDFAGAGFDGSLQIKDSFLRSERIPQDFSAGSLALDGFYFANGDYWAPEQILAKVSGVHGDALGIDGASFSLKTIDATASPMATASSAADVFVVSSTSGRIGDLFLIGEGDKTDTILFADDTKETDIYVEKSGSDLFIHFKGASDVLKLFAWFDNPDQNLQIRFSADNVLWTEDVVRDKFSSAQGDLPLIASSVPVSSLRANVGNAFYYDIPDNFIYDPNDWGRIDDYYLSSASPAWLSIDPVSGDLMGTPGVGDVGSSTATVYARQYINSGWKSIGRNIPLSVVSTSNRVPVLSQQISDQKVVPNSAFNFTIPAGSVIDLDGGALTYSATWADGKSLTNSWLSFNASTRTFTGTPTAIGSSKVRVTVKDSGQLFVIDEFEIHVQKPWVTRSGTAGVDSLLGGEGSDTLWGLDGADRLDGLQDADVMHGGEGDDLYLVDDGLDQIDEAEDAGFDTVQSSISYALPTNVENLDLSSAILISTNGYGNDLNNHLKGSQFENFLNGYAGNDTLDGGAGQDIMLGGMGDDIFYVDSADDELVEFEGEGDDKVITNVDYRLRRHVEVLQMQGNANLIGYGNDGGVSIFGNIGNNSIYGGADDDTLIGNAGDDLLQGNRGIDVMDGGDGNDTYWVDNLGDRVIEPYALGDSYLAGSDTVFASVAFNLPHGVETLVLTGTDHINASSNSNGGVLNGNTGNNTLTGLDAQDYLSGGDGADTLRGGGGNDQLIGGAGVDLLQGGLGDDAYTVNYNGTSGNPTVGDAQDTVEELSDQGTDTIFTNLFSYYLPDNIENLVLGGKDGFNSSLGKDGTKYGYGNGLNNHIAGRAEIDFLFGLDGADTLNGAGGNDLLDGGVGYDSLIGGNGDDTYVVDSTGVNGFTLVDQVVEFSVTESATAGTDTVVTGLNQYQLPANIERLLTSAAQGSGNELNNEIQGADIDNNLLGGAGHDSLMGLGGDDRLDGGDGNDSLVGGLGNDTLVGGSDNDAYVWGRGQGADVIQDSAGADDMLQVQADVSAEQLWFDQLGADLRIRVIGTSDQVLLKDWYTAEVNKVERIVLADGRDLLSSQVQVLVQVMARPSVPIPSLATLPTTGDYVNLSQSITSTWAA